MEGGEIQNSMDLLIPELFTCEGIIELLRQKGFITGGLVGSSKGDLVELCYHNVVPLPQRCYRSNRRGQEMTRRQVALDKRREYLKRKAASHTQSTHNESKCTEQQGGYTELVRDAMVTDRLKPPPSDVTSKRTVIKLKRSNKGQTLDSTSRQQSGSARNSDATVQSNSSADDALSKIKIIQFCKKTASSKTDSDGNNKNVPHTERHQGETEPANTATLVKVLPKSTEKKPARKIRLKRKSDVQCIQTPKGLHVQEKKNMELAEKTLGTNLGQTGRDKMALVPPAGHTGEMTKKKAKIKPITWNEVPPIRKEQNSSGEAAQPSSNEGPSSQPDGCVSGQLRWAITNGDLAKARRLLKGGGDANATYWYDGSLLQEAVSSNNQETVKLLLEFRADVNAANQDGRTALHIAARFGDQDMVTLLLREGADANLQTQDGRTSLHVALWRGHQAVAQLLLNGRNVNVVDDDRWSPLHWVASKDLCDSLEPIVEKGAKLNMVSRAGRTPLHESIVKGNFRIMRSLIRHGADVNIASRTGDCLHLLSQRSDFTQEDVALLLATSARGQSSLSGHMPKNFTKHDHIARTLNTYFNTVTPLINLCRNCIRRIINNCHGGRAIKPFVSELPLPPLIRDFLLLREEFQRSLDVG